MVRKENPMMSPGTDLLKHLTACKDRHFIHENL